MNSKTRAISEGAMMLALMAILLLADRQMAGFFELLLYFLSVPVVIYEVRHGTKMTIALSIAATIIAFMFSTFTGMFYTVTAILIGVVYGYGILKDWNNSRLLFFTILANILITYITVVLFASVFGYDLNEEVRLMMEMVPNVTMPGLDMATIVLEIVVLSYLAIAFMQSVVTHLMSNLLLQRLKLKYRKMNTIYDVHLPKWVALLIILAFIAYNVSVNMTLASWVQQSIMAIYLMAMLCAMYDGCITAMCFFRLLGKGKLAIFLCMFACMIPGLNFAIAALGVWDIIMELRKKWKEGVLREAHREN